MNKPFEKLHVVSMWAFHPLGPPLAVWYMCPANCCVQVHHWAGMPI